MKKNIFLIVFILFAYNSYANDLIEISILTCSPGQEVYSTFGHTAIRIIDKKKQTDHVYNFGLFDFQTPNFTYKFLKGKLKYYRGIQETASFIQMYTSDNRLVSEQKLNLSAIDKSKLIEKLNFLYKPVNRSYYYSFLERNCSTETRDLLYHIGVEFPNGKLEESNRQLINLHLEDKPWLRLGINLILGKLLDNDSTHFQSMFLPEYLKKDIDKSRLNGSSLVKHRQSLNSIKKKDNFPIQSILSPTIVFFLILLILLFWLPQPIKYFICFTIGIAGLLIISLWFFSGHEEVKYNMNILWCSPLYLIYLFQIGKNKISKISVFILIITLSSPFFIWVFNIQEFDSSVLWIIMILGIVIFKDFKKLYQPNIAT